MTDPHTYDFGQQVWHILGMLSDPFQAVWVSFNPALVFILSLIAAFAPMKRRRIWVRPLVVAAVALASHALWPLITGNPVEVLEFMALEPYILFGMCFIEAAAITLPLVWALSQTLRLKVRPHRGRALPVKAASGVVLFTRRASRPLTISPTLITPVFMPRGFPSGNLLPPNAEHPPAP